MKHSGPCINNSQDHGGRYLDRIIIDFTPNLDFGPSGEEDYSHVYKDTSGTYCWVCDNCTKDPQYLLDNLFKLLAQAGVI